MLKGYFKRSRTLIIGPFGVMMILSSSLLLVIYSTSDKSFVKIPTAAAANSFSHDDLAKTSIILDFHSDTLSKLHEARNTSLFTGNKLQETIPLLKMGGYKAQFFAVWIPPGKGFDFADSMIKLFYKVLSENSRDIAYAGSESDLRKNMAQGKISAFLAIEGGDAIGKDLKNIDYFFNKGVRYITLTWNKNNYIAGASKDKAKPHLGLSPFGISVIKRMNQIGMIVDVSHASDETVRDVLRVSEYPIIASHSNCYAITANSRNLKDDLIKCICTKGGVIGVNFYSTFLTGGKSSNISDVVAHINHIKIIGGIDCVSLGSDYDGSIIPPVGLENAGQLHNLTNELIKRGYQKMDIEKIYGLNAVRVIRQVVDKKLK